jgi:DNA repair protein SbcD/Mre11
LFRFIHAADIHLDSPLRGLQRYDGAPADEIRGASRKALENLVRLAVEQEVDFVLIAGDIYDGDWRDHNTGLFFVSQMSLLREAGIPVVMIAGNHDAANRMTKSLRLPENVQLLSAKHSETASAKSLESLGVAIHGRSFARAAESENLARDYPPRRSGMFNIGILHTALDGVEGHARYAPCTLGDLRAKGYDYWALGHVHQRQVVADDPLIVFSGNIQGRHIRETGEKGCFLVTVDGSGKALMEFQPLHVLQWEQCELDASNLQHPESVVDLFSDSLMRLLERQSAMPLALRVIVRGATDCHQALAAKSVQWMNELRAAALDISVGSVWVEKIVFQTSPKLPLSANSLGDGPLSELLATLDWLRSEPEELSRLIQEFTDLSRKLPEELLHGEESISLNSPEQMRKWLDESLPILISRLGIGREA